MGNENYTYQTYNFGNYNGFLIERSGIRQVAIPHQGQVNGNANGNGNGNGNGNVQTVTQAEQNELTNGLNGNGTQNVGQTATQAAAGRKKMNANDAVDQFYYATYRWGTDNEAMEEVLKGIDKNNIMDIMKNWNKYHSKEKGESFMEAFMWDADHTQKVTYGRQISRALRDRAEEVGIYDEKMAADFAKIDNELRSAYIENDIYKRFDSIIAQIAEAEADAAAEKETDPAKKADARNKALEYSTPYSASSETKNGWDRFWDEAGKICDSVGDFLFGWM